MKSSCSTGGNPRHLRLPSNSRSNRHFQPNSEYSSTTITGPLYDKNISLVSFKDIAFQKVDFNTIDLKNCNIVDSDFFDSDFSSVRFMTSLLKNISFSKSRLINVIFSNNIIENTSNSFTQGTIEFSNCLLHNCIFKEDEMDGVIFEKCDLTDCDFSRANLKNTTFIDCDFTGVSISNSFDLSFTRILNPIHLSKSRIPRDIQQQIKNINITIGTEVSSPLPSTISPSSPSDSPPLFIPPYPSFPSTPSDSTLDNIMVTFDQIRTLLQRSHLRVKPYQKTKGKLFKDKNPSVYDVITMEDTQLCEYIKDPNNLIIFYEGIPHLLTRKNLSDPIDMKSLDINKIVFQCKKLDNAFTPRRSNITGEPQLSMDLFGIHGVMIPLSYLDFIINNTFQIYVIDKCSRKSQVPIASLNTILGGNVVSANHCQALVPIKSCNIFHIENKWLERKCTNPRRATRKTKNTEDNNNKNTTRRPRCPNGTRRNKKTGLCEDK